MRSGDARCHGSGMTNEDELEGLSVQETAAIAALMSSPTIETAAERVGLNERTLRRWLDREHFRRALRREQRAVMTSVTSQLQRLASKAVGALEGVLDDGEAPHASKVTAARAVLEMAREDIQLSELSERIEELEARQAKGAR